MKNLEVYDFNKKLVDSIEESKNPYIATFDSIYQIFLLFSSLLVLSTISTLILGLIFYKIILTQFLSLLLVPVLAPFIIKANKKKDKDKELIKRHLIDKKLQNISFVLKKENVFVSVNSLENASTKLIKKDTKNSEYNILFIDDENKIRILKEISEILKKGIIDSKLYLLTDEEVKKEMDSIQLTFKN